MKTLLLFYLYQIVEMLPGINQQVSSKLQSYLLDKYECMEIIYILRMGIFFKGNTVIFIFIPDYV